MDADPDGGGSSGYGDPVITPARRRTILDGAYAADAAALALVFTRTG